MGEYFDLPSSEFSEKRPVRVVVTPQSFPGQRFQLGFEWNGERERYVLRIEHTNRGDNGFKVTRGMVQYRRIYSYLPFIQFFFDDPTGKTEAITPENLGTDVLLFAVPGPEGAEPETWDRPPEWAE
jgi:hypothetical protein